MSTASDEGDRIPMSQRERDCLRVLHSVLEVRSLFVSDGWQEVPGVPHRAGNRAALPASHPG